MVRCPRHGKARSSLPRNRDPHSRQRSLLKLRHRPRPAAGAWDTTQHAQHANESQGGLEWHLRMCHGADNFLIRYKSKHAKGV